MEQDWSTLLVTVAGAAVGAILPLVWPHRGGGGGEGRSIDGSTVHGDVHQGDDKRRYKVRIDNRVIHQVSVDARQLVPAGPTPSAPRPAPSSGAGDEDETWGTMVGLVLLVGLCVVGYLRFREPVIEVVMAVQLFAFSVAAGALVVARLRSVVYGPGVTVQLLLSLVMGIVSVLSLRWLTRPPFEESAGLLREVLVHGPGMGLVQLVQAYGVPGVAFLAYQLLGLVASTLAMAFVVLHSLKVFVAAGIAVRFANDPAHRPGAMRMGVLRFGGTTTGCWAAAVGMTLMGLLLVSGAGFELLNHLQESMPQPVTQTPTPPAPVASTIP